MKSMCRLTGEAICKETGLSSESLELGTSLKLCRPPQCLTDCKHVLRQAENCHAAMISLGGPKLL